MNRSLSSRSSAVIASLSVALLALFAGPTATQAAATPACRVANTTHPATYRTIRRAVSAAQPGDRLVLQGTCAGPVTIDKDLTVVGRKTKATGTPTLTGKDTTRVVRVSGDVNITLRKLVIRDGYLPVSFNYPANAGAGILATNGTTTLIDVILRDNVTASIDGGGGAIEIMSDPDVATVVLAGASQIRGSTGGYGGAIENYGVLTIKGTTRIHHNTSTQWGGGVYNLGTMTLTANARIDHNTSPADGGGIRTNGTLTLSGSAVIDANTATQGAGLFQDGGSLTASDGAQIRDNTASQSFGGFRSAGGASSGIVCGTNVHDNAPEDCGP